MHLPPLLTGPDAWIGSELASTPEQWLYTLTGEEIDDLEQATDILLESGKHPGNLGKQDFPLSVFDQHLSQLRETLLSGIGVEVIRGLPVARYTTKFVSMLFCGIGAHLGSARSQNAKGDFLGHVLDTGADSANPNVRIYQTAERQTFHTDSADVVGLLCLHKAKSGGESLLVSAKTLYNQIKLQRPELLSCLFDRIATDRRGEIPPGAKPYMEIPPFNWYQEKLTVFYQRQYIDSAQRFDDAMRLTDRHIEALDLFDQLADDPQLHLKMQLEPGDIQFVYNHGQLHDRNGFIDWQEPKKRRHLLRLWLSPQRDRPLPPCFIERYGSIEIGNRGGVVTQEMP